MQTVYIGNTLVNDVMLGSQRMDDVLTALQPIQIEYLVVAGGGGTKGQAAGGGGGGGLLSGSANLARNIIYKVQVGGGGNPENDITSGNGLSSYLTGSNLYVTASGGGFGGTVLQIGGNGANGGGAGINTDNATYYAGGTGSLGFNGGGGANTANSGSGGGAGAGQPGNFGLWSKGGNGLQSAIAGTLKYYAGGGGGQDFGGNSVAGGFGGGASGSENLSDGGNHLGGGAGGGLSSPEAGWNYGGSGIVIVRYLGPQKATGGTVTTDGDYIIHSFTSSLRLVSANFDLQTN